MKTTGLIQILGVFLSISLSAQSPLKYKPHPYLQKDSLYSKQFQNQLKQRYQFNNKLKRFNVPDKQFLPGYQNLAMVPDSRKIVQHKPNTNMPVLVPRFRSKMPVMKPDPNIHYFLKIKK